MIGSSGRRLCSSAVLGLLLAGMLLGGRSTQAAPAAQDALPAEMIGVEWELVSLQPSGESAEDTTGQGITLRFEADGAANGSGGCNRFFTSYTVGDNQSLTFGVIGGTLMACGDPADARERRYYQALEDVSAFSLADGELRLKSGASGELVFAGEPNAPAAPASPPTQLPATGGAGTTPSWMLLAALFSLGLGGWLWRRARAER